MMSRSPSQLRIKGDAFADKIVNGIFHLIKKNGYSPDYPHVHAAIQRVGQKVKRRWAKELPAMQKSHTDAAAQLGEQVQEVEKLNTEGTVPVMAEQQMAAPTPGIEVPSAR